MGKLARFGVLVGQFVSSVARLGPVELIPSTSCSIAHESAACFLIRQEFEKWELREKIVFEDTRDQGRRGKSYPARIKEERDLRPGGVRDATEWQYKLNIHSLTRAQERSLSHLLIDGETIGVRFSFKQEASRVFIELL